MELYFVKLRRESIFHLLNIIYWKLVSKINRLEKNLKIIGSGNLFPINKIQENE